MWRRVTLADTHGDAPPCRCPRHAEDGQHDDRACQRDDDVGDQRAARDSQWSKRAISNEGAQDGGADERTADTDHDVAGDTVAMLGEAVTRPTNAASGS